MILLSLALLAAPAAATAGQCRTTEAVLTEAHGYFARVQPMMDNRRRLAEQLDQLRGGEARSDAAKNPAVLRKTLSLLGPRIERERQSSAAKIAALQLAC